MTKVIQEGVYDPGILKAIFLAGGPGSGKGFVSSNLFGVPSKINISQYGLKVINQDTEFEHFLKKYGFGTDLDNMPDEIFRQLTDPSYDDYSGLRSRTKELSLTRLKLYTSGRLGVILDGTGHNYEHIVDQKKELESLGYDTYMIFVDTTLDIALKRNASRARKVKESIVTSSWKEVQKNKNKYKQLFKKNFVLVDNSKHISDVKSHFDKLTKKYVNKIVKMPVQNKLGKKWIEKQLLLKKTGVTESIDSSIKRTVVVYGGRFQPFSLHHLKTYQWLVNKFGKGNVFITTSSITKPPKHPLTFKEKVKHMVNMGVPKNKIIQEVTPYVAVNLLKKLDTQHTAIVYVFGEKDAGRLGTGHTKSGKPTYFQLYNKNKNSLKNADEHGYVLVAPHVSIKVLGKELNGTLTRELLGKSKYNSDREQIFKQVFGYYDKNMLNLFVDKFSKLFNESITENTKKFRSAGIVVYTKTPDGVKYLLLYDGKNWGFPKGHVDNGESDIEAAKRETKEETGLSNIKIKPGFKQVVSYYVKYDYIKQHKLKSPAKKTVIYYLGESNSTKVKLSHEHTKYKWVTCSEGVKLLRFGSNVLQSADNFNKVTSDIIEFFLIDNNFNDVLQEVTYTALSPVDDGPPTFYKSFSEYKRISEKWIKSMYENIGWKIINYILSDGADDPEIDYTLKYNIVPAVAYGKSGDGKGYPNPIQKYKDRLRDVVGPLGWKIVNWMGIYGKGIGVEAPVPAGVDGEVENTDNMLSTNGLKEHNMLLSNVDTEYDPRELLLCGGAFGHLTHIFEDMDLTFGDFKQIITTALQGKLDRVQEKIDGMNIMVSWRDGKLISARTKKELANRGENANSIQQMKSKFKGRGDIADAFSLALDDLNSAISKLSEKQRTKIFANGAKFMNLEVVYPKTEITVPYGLSMLIFHATVEYDKQGNAIGQNTDDARMLGGMIKQINQHIQKTFSIKANPILTLPPVQNFSKQQAKFLTRLSKLQKEFNLKDSDKVLEYHRHWWINFIKNTAKDFGYKIPYDVLHGLTARWGLKKKSEFKVHDIKKIENDKFRNWALLFEKTDYDRQFDLNIQKFENLILELGVQVLRDVDQFLVANPDQAIQKMRKELLSAISTLNNTTDVNKLKIFKKYLERLEAIGGTDVIIPSEGITFSFKGKLYKLNGQFTPLHRIISLLKF